MEFSFAGTTQRVTNKWWPRPPRRGRSAHDDDAAVTTRHAASQLERRLGPGEAGALSVTTAEGGGSGAEAGRALPRRAAAARAAGRQATA